MLDDELQAQVWGLAPALAFQALKPFQIRDDPAEEVAAAYLDVRFRVRRVERYLQQREVRIENAFDLLLAEGEVRRRQHGGAPGPGVADHVQQVGIEEGLARAAQRHADRPDLVEDATEAVERHDLAPLRAVVGHGAHLALQVASGRRLELKVKRPGLDAKGLSQDRQTGPQYAPCVAHDAPFSSVFEPFGNPPASAFAAVFASVAPIWIYTERICWAVFRI